MDEFEEDDDDVNEAILAGIDLIVNFQKHLAYMTRHYITVFFANKEWACGGAIPKPHLYASARIANVQNLDINKAVQRAYQLMGTDTLLEDIQLENTQLDIDDTVDSTVKNDTKVVIEVLAECRRKGIPKVFAGGILVMYLELCLGLKDMPSEGAAAL